MHIFSVSDIVLGAWAISVNTTTQKFFILGAYIPMLLVD